MKKTRFIGFFSWLPLAVLMMFGTQGCSSETDVVVGNRTTMEVDLVYDAGEVIQGEFITAKIKVKNTGAYPLVIASATAGCSCTVASKPEEPILPGKTGAIIAQVDTDKTATGRIEKPLNIVSNAQKSTTVVTIKANVLRKK